MSEFMSIQSILFANETATLALKSRGVADINQVFCVPYSGMIEKSWIRVKRKKKRVI
jgi:Cu2+-containing amine oxidase